MLDGVCVCVPVLGVLIEHSFVYESNGCLSRFHLYRCHPQQKVGLSRSKPSFVITVGCSAGLVIPCVVAMVQLT